jgi:two-component system alkaline phosphatase synthesis response regulator PhoP
MHERILVVDDDPSIVGLLTANLEGEGYGVIKGYDGQAAIHLAKVHRPQLIILDLNMPMTNGLKAVEGLRAQEASREVPIILLTGEASEKVYSTLQAVGRLMHIKKPVDLEELNTLIRQLLARHSPQK